MINTTDIGKIFKLARREWIRIDLMAAIIGIFAGYGAIFFRLLISFFHNLFYTAEINFHSNVAYYNQSILYVFIPAFGLLIAAWLANTFAPEAKGHGVPEVMEAQTVRGGKIRGIVVVIKSLASSITIASGGSVGREGPIVQVGAAGSSYLGQLFKQRSRILRILVGCGVAASIAATFNTPIGGVIFAIELILLELSTHSFIPLVISSVFATIISRIHLGNKPSFLTPSYTLTSPYELSFYLGLGIISGGVG
ncbi:MAG: chloride channel protein, partial [Candidatus Dadabacteria bacterium]